MKHQEQVVALLGQLRDLGCHVWVEDDKLRLRAAKNTLTPALRAQLTEHKAAILSFLRSAQAPVHSDKGIPVLAEAGPKTLSFAQQRLWFMDQMGTGAAYNMIAALNLKGRLDVDALRWSLSEIVRRHASLRTTFTVKQGTPYQVIHPHEPVGLRTVDLTGYSETEQQAQVERLTREEADLSFDLTCDLMMRATLLQQRVAVGGEQGEHTLLLVFHHIAGDGWSMGIFMDELAALYTAFSQDQPSPLAELPIQYADFAAWQRNWLQGDELTRQLNYWKERLTGSPELIQLPTDYPRPARPQFLGGAVSVSLDPSLSEQIQQLSLQQGATLYAVLLTAWQILLMRYSGQSDIVVGSPIANRNRREIEPLIGLFVNNLVIRTDLSSRNGRPPTFLELLRQVKETVETAYDHQDLPFDRLVEELQPDRQLNYNPLFQVGFAMQNAPTGTLTLPDLTVEEVVTGVRTTRFDLELYLWETEEGLQGNLVYNTDLFKHGTIERMHGHLNTLLTAIVANPEHAITQFPLMTEAERHQVLVTWNDTAADDSEAQCLHHLFEQQVERTPDAIALIFEDEALTYAEVNRRANQLAHHLIQAGVAPGDTVGTHGRNTLVAVMLDRSPQMIISLFAILKAGGAFVPIDPTYPQDRLRYMLHDSAAPLLLTESRLSSASLPQDETHPIQVIALDTIASQLDDRPATNPQTRGSAQNLTYIIYTSGSTGQPKGVLVEHGAVCLAGVALRQVFPHLEPGGRLLQLASFSFDASLFETMLALPNGMTLVFPPTDHERSGNALADLLQTQRITHLATVPSVIQTLPDVDLPHLKVLVTGAEACPSALVRRWGHGRTFVNVYGPTESPIWTTCTVLEPDQPVHIGRPIRNRRVYILDERTECVPIGVAGELYIGGPYLARGYHNRPELTSQRFVHHPQFGRLYKTGDLCRWLPEGIEFLGRTDDQVKIRGFRVEPGEIEARLTNHPAVREAIVLMREDQPQRKQLVGYLVADQVDEALQTEHVTRWQTLYENVYRQAPQPVDPTLNIVGWNNSYTEEPFPKEEMEEWVRETVADIRRLKPRRIYEIGCGSGLLLFRLAPYCDEYQGVDYSLDTVQKVERIKHQAGLDHVHVAQRMADDFEGIDDHRFDCVIINSVIQYFPSIDYLIRVLEGAVRIVRPGGKIYLGDVRNLRLLHAFHAAVQTSRAEDGLSLDALQMRIQRRILEEEELLIDPDFFHALPAHLPRISSVEVQLKEATYVNELTQFRYQVVLAVDDVPTDEAASISWQESFWQSAWTVTDLEALLNDHLRTPERGLLIRNIPNGRVQDPIQTLKILEAGANDPSAPETVDALRTRLADQPARIRPEQIWQLAKQQACSLQVTWSASPGMMDVILVPETENGETHQALISSQLKQGPLRAWQHYANNPLLGRHSRILIPQIKAWLHEQLPDYMVPSILILLDSLPLNPSGKVNRKALPPPVLQLRSQEDGFVQPQTPVQRFLAEIWIETLGVEAVSIHDNFFQLGGHSLLATQVVSRIREHFQVDLPVRSVFEHRKLSELAAVIERRVREAAGHDKLPPIEALPGDTIKPLSFAQQRLWLLSWFEGVADSYNMPMAFRLKGDLNLDALRATFTFLVERHESFRMVFPETDGQPRIMLHPVEDVASLRYHDLRGLGEQARTQAIQKHADTHAQCTFDVTRDVLFRTDLLQVGDREHVLLLNMHHIISDGWSMGVLMREWHQIYAAFARGTSPILAPPAIQYSDYAAWQRGWLQGALLEKQLRYWQTQLEGVPELLELPGDRPRPVQQSHHGAHHEQWLSASLAGKVKALCQQQGCSLFMTMFSAFTVLLHKYSNADDFCVASPIAGRNHSQTENLIGFFVNTLVLRSRINPEQSFLGLLHQTRQTCLDAYAHQDIPFDYLIEQLQPERSMSHAPLAQVLFSLLNVEDFDLSMQGLEIERVDQHYPFARLDLSLNVAERDGQLYVLWEYATDLFDETTIHRMAEHFRVLLGAIVATPSTPIHTLPLMSTAEIEQLQAWNQTEMAFPDLTVVEMFEDRVGQQPDRPAVVSDTQQLTFRELNEQANQLAHHLIRNYEITPDTIIAICMEKSLANVVGLLAILKAGAAYLPIDPDHPHERIRFMLGDCGVSVCLTTTALKHRLPEVCHLLCCDEASFVQESTHNPSRQSKGDHLAYVIYTSGSTGQPKGVMIEHRALTNLIVWHQRTFDVQAGDRSSLLVNVAFDASIWELWPSLTAGASVHPMPKGTLDTLRSLTHWLQRHEITLCASTPALVERWSAEEAVPTPHLRLLHSGGDTLHRCPDNLPCRLVNNYGPTENTVVSTSIGVSPEATPTIGRPIANVRVYLVDRYHQPLPVGIPGELCLAGHGLARGYLNRPELTARQFVTLDLFGRQERVYKTGDLARLRADGELEFLGRIDRQVKLRGFRIELGEIEQNLAQHECVRMAIVRVHEAPVGHKQLLAHVATGTPPEETPDLANRLKAHLKNQLPEYMVPSRIVILESMPLTANGKIDHKALPDPDETVDTVYVAPRSETEHKLAERWSAVLKRDSIGIDDNFFALGGHSLLAFQLLGQIKQHLNHQLSLSTLFHHPTIAGLAAQIDARSGAAASNLLSIQPAGEKAPLFCVAGGNGYAFYFRDLAEHLGTDQPLFGLEAPGREGDVPLPVSVEDHARQLVDTMRQQQPRGPYFLAGYSSGGALAFEMAVQLEQQGETVGSLTIFDAGMITDNTSLIERSEFDWMWNMVERVEALKETSSGITREHLLALPDDEARWNVVTERFHQLQLLPEYASLDLLRQGIYVGRMLTLNHAHYQTRQKIDAPILLYRADDVNQLIANELRMLSDYDLPDWGWQAYTRSTVRIVHVPGNHGTMLAPPDVQILARSLSQELIRFTTSPK